MEENKGFLVAKEAIQYSIARKDLNLTEAGQHPFQERTGQEVLAYVTLMCHKQDQILIMQKEVCFLYNSQ